MKFTDCIEIVGSKPTLYEGTKQYVSTGAVEKYFINKNSIEEYTYNERPSRADLVGKSGDILFAKMAETKKTLILDKETENYLFSTGFFAIRPKSGILTTKCLYYLLNSKNFLSQKDKNSSGATQKAITNSGLEKINVNIPLFSKQDHIVKQFDLLTDIIKKYQSQLEKLDFLIKSRFIEMFGEPATNPKKWEIKTLDEVCKKITDGKHGGCKLEDNSDYYYVGAREIFDLNIHYETAQEITKEDFEKDYKRCNLEIGDFCIVNTGATIGKTAIAKDVRSTKTLLQKSVALLKTKENLLSALYLQYSYITNPSMYKVENASAQPNLLLSKIRETKIMLPPLFLQNDFASFVQQIDKSKFAVQKSLEKTETLYKSLMQRYFA